jgi:hypothetical protein
MLLSPTVTRRNRFENGLTGSDQTRMTELLWVDQDSATISPPQSRPRTRRLINSHVQRFSKNSLWPNRAHHVHTNIATFQRWRLEKSTNSPTPAESSRDAPPNESGGHPLREDSQTQFDKRPSNSTPGSLLVSRSVELSCAAGFRGEAFDPFNATTTKLDPLVLQLLHYYIHVLVPSKWHVDYQSNQKLARIEAASKNVIQGCLANELHMFSLLASMASRMQNLELWSTAPPTDFYIHKALVALRRYLDVKPFRIETQVFYDMFFLCTAEAYRYNLAASMTHLRAIAQLIEMAGGLNRLENHMLLETLVQGDIMLAVEQLAPPVFPLTWDPGPFPHAQWEVIKMVTPLRKLGQAVLKDPILPLTLRTITHDIVQCVQVAQYVWTHPDSPNSNLEWIYLRYLAILYRLLNFGSASWQTEAFRIALVMWVMIIMTSLGIRRAVKIIVPRLKQALLASEVKTDEQSSKDGNGLLLWVLMVGSVSSVGSSDEEWFVSQLAEVANRLQLWTQSQLRKFLLDYFFLDSAQSASLSALAGKLAGCGALSPPASVSLTTSEELYLA